MKLSPVVKISLSGLILALVIIFTRFLSIQNIPILPFVRISIGPALIIFASILLGPIYGGIIGGASDILGIFLVPNALGYSINPWFTLVYTGLGILPWCIYKLVKLIKNDKISLFVVIAILLALWLFVVIYGSFQTKLLDNEFTLGLKILIFVISFLMIAGTAIIIVLIKHHYDNEVLSVYNIAILSIIVEVIVMLIANSFAKSVFFGIEFKIVFFMQAIIFFFDIPMNTILISYLLKLANKVFNKENHLIDETK